MNTFNKLKNAVILKDGDRVVSWGDCKTFSLFAGPDIIEDEGLVLEVGQEIKRVCKLLGIPWVLKCSYDKANRQSLGSFRGPGMSDALKSFEKIKSELDCFLLTDVHETIQVEGVSKVADVIQIPAFLSRQRIF